MQSDIVESGSPAKTKGPSRRATSVVLRYGLACVSVAAALGLAQTFLYFQLPQPFAALALSAIAITFWYGGIRPGILSALLASIVRVYFFEPEVDLVSRILYSVVFLIFALLMIQLTRARDQLDGRVAERTAELTRTNEDLTLEIAARRRAERDLEDLAGRLITAQEEERSRIGRELHDHISQLLGVLTIKIDQLRARPEMSTALGGALDELRRDTSAITHDVHRLSHRLHSSTLDYLGLVPALQKLVTEFSERHNISITFTHTSLPPSLPSEVSLCLFRIAEESLTNIAKHSQARSATIQVAGAPDGIHLTVEDAGAGFDMATLGSKPGLGLVSMQERLRVLHGTVQVDSAPSRGTRIDAWVPPLIFTSAHNEAGHRSETA
jgi:signal transduction histidine kinase